MKIQRRSFLLGACGSALAAVVHAQENRDRAYLAVWATTQNMNLGLPALPPGLKLEDLPPEAAAALGGLAGPKKELEVRLWSPGAAPSAATATLDVPGGLNLGDSLPLELLRPEARKAQAAKVELPEEYRITDDFEIRQYWGCSETVLPGQPKVWKLGDLPVAEREAWKRFSAQGGIDKPDWTEGVWPNAKTNMSRRNPRAAKPGSLKGDHKLRTSFLGDVPFQVSGPVDFLDPVVFETPKPGKADLKQHIPLRWKPIANALGYHLTAVAPKGRKLLIMWAGGKNSQGTAGGLQFPQMAEVREFVEKGIYLPPSATACNIPAGIFEGCRQVMIQMTAYGPGQAFEAPNSPAVRVQTRSIGMLTLGIGLDE